MSLLSQVTSAILTGIQNVTITAKILVAAFLHFVAIKDFYLGCTASNSELFHSHFTFCCSAVIG